MAKQAEAPPFPFAPDEVVVAMESFAGHPNFNIRQGARLRGNNPAVLAHPAHFLPDGASDEDRQAAMRALYPEREPAPTRPIAVEQVLRDEHAVIATRRVLSKSHGDGMMNHIAPMVLVEAGDRLALNNPIYKQYPDAFVLVMPPGCTRANSLRAKETVAEYVPQAGAGYQLVGKPILKGTYAREDHKLILANPASFERVPPS